MSADYANQVLPLPIAFTAQNSYIPMVSNTDMGSAYHICGTAVLRHSKSAVRSHTGYDGEAFNTQPIFLICVGF